MKPSLVWVFHDKRRCWKRTSLGDKSHDQSVMSHSQQKDTCVIWEDKILRIETEDEVGKNFLSFFSGHALNDSNTRFFLLLLWFPKTINPSLSCLDMNDRWSLWVPFYSLPFSLTPPHFVHRLWQVITHLCFFWSSFSLVFRESKTTSLFASLFFHTTWRRILLLHHVHEKRRDKQEESLA